MSTAIYTPERPELEKGNVVRLLHESWRGARARVIHWPSALLDLFLTCVSGLISVLMLGRLQTGADSLPAKEHLGLQCLFTVLVILNGLNYGLYQRRRMRPLHSELSASLKAVLLAAFFAVVTSFFLLQPAAPYATYLLVLSACTATAFFSWRALKIHYVRTRAANGGRARKVLIIGTDHGARDLANSFKNNPEYGYSVIGFLDEKPISNGNGNTSGMEDVLGTLTDLPRIIRSQFVDEVHIAGLQDRVMLNSVLESARHERVEVKYMNEWLALAQRAPLEYFGALPVLSLHREETRWAALAFKRSFDVVGSMLALIVAAPLMLAIAVAIKLDSSGPVLYCAERMGLRGRKFMFYKFRTMVVDADRRKTELLAGNERQGPVFKLKNDPRITRVGRFLRKYSLDEFPQFWNVLIGDMSLVGPRPHPLDDYSRYLLHHLRRLDVTPGITGLWQIMARNDPSFERAMELDLTYIEKWSLLLDLKILLRTMPAVVLGTGV
jgi:exopolysaccharide biosynthesis polyprenyl glycosylphosphotransferase